MLGIEICYNYSGPGLPVLVVSRVSILFCCMGGLLIALWQDFFQRHADVILPTLYHMIGCILIVMYAGCSALEDHSLLNIHHDYPPYLFYLGKWSLPNSLILFFVVFSTSGLRFTEAFFVCALHGILFYAILFLQFSGHYMQLVTVEVYYLPAFFIMIMVSNHDIEWQVRQGFLLKCDIGEDLRRQDELILSILPAEISDAIKSKKLEHLAEYYDNVTILFCSIVDFGRQSSSTYAQDLVALLIRVITMFDRIVDLTGVYKVENIAETYMCCGGCPQQCDDHAVRVAKMALAMMEAVQACGWRWSDGTPVALQIGIHTGPVVAGVVGSKSYSYHLFGDSVNTCMNTLITRLYYMLIYVIYIYIYIYLFILSCTNVFSFATWEDTIEWRCL